MSYEANVDLPDPSRDLEQALLFGLPVTIVARQLVLVWDNVGVIIRLLVGARYLSSSKESITVNDIHNSS